MVRVIRAFSKRGPQGVAPRCAAPTPPPVASRRRAVVTAPPVSRAPFPPRNRRSLETGQRRRCPTMPHPQHSNPGFPPTGGNARTATGGSAGRPYLVRRWLHALNPSPPKGWETGPRRKIYYFILGRGLHSPARIPVTGRPPRITSRRSHPGRCQV